MPKSGDYDAGYPARLLNIGIELVGEFCGAKKHHNLKCAECGYEWRATPISKLQNYKKHKHTGCPKCIKAKQHQQVREHNINIIEERFEILSTYDGQVQTTSTITVRNKKCQHIFEAYPGNLLHRDVKCPICATKYRTEVLNKSSKDRSEEWSKTATDWQLYKSKVASLSRKNYLQNKDQINPNNLPRGKAGEEGAYHLDHIVPVRYCFEHNIPEEVCAHPENLQMLGWRANVGSRDKLKEGVEIPAPLKKFLLCV